MAAPTNSELGQLIRSLRKTYLEGMTIEDLAEELRRLTTPDRGPSRQLSRTGLQRRETGSVDIELSVFLMVLSLAGLRVLVVDDDGRPLPPQFQVGDVPDGPPRGTDFLTIAATLQREVDRLVRMAQLDREFEDLPDEIEPEATPPRGSS